MSDVILKDESGVPRTYSGVNKVSLPKADGSGNAVFAEPYEVVYTYDSTMEEWSCDHTYSEIRHSAVVSGEKVEAKFTYENTHFSAALDTVETSVLVYFAPVSEDAGTGVIILTHDASDNINLHKTILDDKLDTSGGYMSGDINFDYGHGIQGTSALGVGTMPVHNVKMPEGAYDAANKKYVDDTTMPKVTDAVQGNLAAFDENGNVVDSGKKLPQIKTTMDAVAVPNSKYYLGQQSSVNITMPSSVSVGDTILVCFTSGSTACILTCDLVGFDFVPKANKTSLLKFTCVGIEQWICESKEG